MSPGAINQKTAGEKTVDGASLTLFEYGTNQSGRCDTLCPDNGGVSGAGYSIFFALQL
jgi:hypothetical protein